MIERGGIAEILKGSDEKVLMDLPAMLPELSQTEIFDLLDLIESPEFFQHRLPLRIQLYGKIAQHAPQHSLKLIALLRLLRRLGARQDVPDLGEIPEETGDFADYLARRAYELCEDENLAFAVEALAFATSAYRSGDVVGMDSAAEGGIEALSKIGAWENPPLELDLESLALAEAGHELTFIAANAAFRAGDVARARDIAEKWSGNVNSWEAILGPLARQRYQYYQLVGRLDFEVGLYEPAIEAYAKALELAPTPYRRAFVWFNMAQIEHHLGHIDASWEYASKAIDATLSSPYPQAAATWIEWLALDADSPSKLSEIENMRSRFRKTGAVETNRVTRAMTRLYRVLATLRSTEDPSGIVPILDELIRELEGAGSWPNMVTILATKAVVAGRLDDRDAMDDAIAKARTLISTKLAPEARPPHEFLLESAHALALRNVGAYDEAFAMLFERALEARMKYPGAVGPDEKTALEAIYYLGALAGHDPETIEKRLRDILNSVR